MDFALSEEQSAIFEMAREFSMENIAPNAVEWDQAKHFPLDVIKKTAELGMAGIYTRDDIGGSDLTRLDAALIFEALSHGCPATASFLSIHNMCSWMIDTFGSEDMRQKWGPKLTSMETVASYCLTEPGSGSDAASLKTTAKRDGDTYVLKGTKSFISGGGVSDLYIVMARTGEPGPKGISAFLMEKGTPGLSYGANEKKMGWNVQPTTEVVMDDVVIPAANLLGKEGDGFKYAMKGLDGGRLNIAASALGAAQAALDKTLSYMSERQAFGKSINQFQALQFRLADMEIELQAARVFLYKAAWTYDQGTPDATKYCAMAKRFVTDTAFDVANQALQLHGGYGYLADYGIEKIVRDLRVHQILEGTNEIMRLIVSRQILSE
ncbi:acyl-CoA dehydrogenase family protein [uncultured Maritalea sp.]|jgi:alkylation response protein AidB-like acyl-CoA dehydrogenase|uniref:acyl-CoA dehydrogenase family protein n=1 Tax=uncultured Maritalea sp. TaxID=757249 RepID=UPI00261A9384|nr:acyl-CoA dehydrogenase family protein [uncultured Maritalea sp.]